VEDCFQRLSTREFSLSCPLPFQPASSVRTEQVSQPSPVEHFAEHAWWDVGNGWKRTLNNLRLILQSHVFYCLLLPWLGVFDLPCPRTGFLESITLMNLFHAALPT
jgi:hypothetical protein